MYTVKYHQLQSAGTSIAVWLLSRKCQWLSSHISNAQYINDSLVTNMSSPVFLDTLIARMAQIASLKGGHCLIQEVLCHFIQTSNNVCTTIRTVNTTCFIFYASFSAARKGKTMLEQHCRVSSGFRRNAAADELFAMMARHAPPLDRAGPHQLAHA